MTYHDIDDESGEALYKEKVCNRLIRTHRGLSLHGMIGVGIMALVGVIYLSTPVAVHHPNTIEADVRRAGSICDRVMIDRRHDDDRCLTPIAAPSGHPPY
jgi:hypothetical protein